MSLVTFTVVLLMFLMDTSIFFIDVNNAVKEIMFTLTSSSDLSLPDRYSLTDNLPWPVESALYAFMVSSFGYKIATTLSPQNYSRTSATSSSSGACMRFTTVARTGGPLLSPAHSSLVPSVRTAIRYLCTGRY